MPKVKNFKDIQRLLDSFFAQEKTIIFAYLFGSVILGRAGGESDVDLAVYLDPEEVGDLFAKRLDLIGRMQAVLKSPVDVVILNDVRSVFLRFVIIKEGKVLFERDHGRRVDFELRTMQAYYDFQPFLEEYNEAYLQKSLGKSS